MRKLLSKKIFSNKRTGFVSLLALILANVFLMIGLSVYAISIKELNLSFGGRESLFAFYAADGGMECALYWDIQHDAFATTSPPRLDEITCNKEAINGADLIYTPNGNEGKSKFNFSFGPNDSDPCVTVTVEKQVNAGGGVITEIIARGRNSCDPHDPRRVERAWRVTYQ